MGKHITGVLFVYRTRKNIDCVRVFEKHMYRVFSNLPDGIDTGTTVIERDWKEKIDNQLRLFN